MATRKTARGGRRPPSPPITLERIKKLAVMAMFSDDLLLDSLVLKGGNAMALIHQLSSRESVDLDFSLAGDFPVERDAMTQRIANALQRTFRPEGYEPFDLKMVEQPKQLSDDIAHFWGGYAIEFKLAPTAVYAEHRNDLEQLRRVALQIGQGKKFLIDISRAEYVEDKQREELEGYIIYVYSPEMIACEKLRAICQQLPEYAEVVHRGERRPGSQRARDFLDIHTLIANFKFDLTAERPLFILQEMFRIKRVELDWLALIEREREFHRQGFLSVTATVSTSFDLEDFDFYFDYVSALARRILARVNN